MPPRKVLFVCIHNSARSQMAEAYLNKLGAGAFIAESAGLTPGKLNLLVAKVMKEDNIDISQNKTKSVFDFFKEGRKYHYVITVCDASASQQCPIFPGAIKSINWTFTDPSAFKGTEDEKIAQTRVVRDQIKNKITGWIKEFGS